MADTPKNSKPRSLEELRADRLKILGRPDELRKKFSDPQRLEPCQRVATKAVQPPAPGG